MGVKVQILFNHEHLDGIKASAALQGKPLPDDYYGPEFDNVDLGPTFHHDFVGIRPVVKAGEPEVTYMYPTRVIGRIKVEPVAEHTTESGIVVVEKPGIQVIK